jgi:hypothetical protein
LEELLSEDWPRAVAAGNPATRHKTATERTANDRMVRNVIENPCLQV